MESNELCSICYEAPIFYKKVKQCKACHRKMKLASAPKCMSCKTRPVEIRKRHLCISCYQRDQRLIAFRGVEAEVGKVKCDITLSKHEYQNEIYFIKNYFTHKNWMFHPATFHMGIEKYGPDFYDGERNVFIEVVGTRQAYHLNKTKYELFRRTYPLIKFEIRQSDGSLLDETEGRKQWAVVSSG